MSNKFIGDFTKVGAGTQDWEVFFFLGSNSWRVSGGAGESIQFCNSMDDVDDCEIIGKLASSVNNVNHKKGLILRYVDVNNFYFFTCTGTKSSILKRVGGVTTELGFAVCERVVNVYVWFRFRVLCCGLSLEGSLDGITYVPVIFVNDSDLSTGKAGFYHSSTSSAFKSYFDDIECNEHNPTP